MKKMLSAEQVLADLRTKAITIRLGSPDNIAEEAPSSYKDVTEVVRVCTLPACGASLFIRRGGRHQQDGLPPRARLCHKGLAGPWCSTCYPLAAAGLAGVIFYVVSALLSGLGYSGPGLRLPVSCSSSLRKYVY